MIQAGEIKEEFKKKKQVKITSKQNWQSQKHKKSRAIGTSGGQGTVLKKKILKFRDFLKGFFSCLQDTS